MDNKSIVLRKAGGFYQVFDNDALIVIIYLIIK